MRYRFDGNGDTEVEAEATGGDYGDPLTFLPAAYWPAATTRRLAAIVDTTDPAWVVVSHTDGAVTLEEFTGGGGITTIDTATPTDITGILKGVSGTIEQAVAGTDYAAASHSHSGADITSGTIAEARIHADIARDSEVTAAIAAHTGDTSDAHDASAISVNSATLTGTGTDVQAVFEELDNAIAALVPLSVNQSSHGFAVGDVLKLSGTTYATAQADTAANAEVVGIVSAVADANNFTLTTGGRVTGLSSLTAGTVYFLSPSSAGDLTATEPSTAGQVSKPLLVADTTTSGFFANFRGLVIPGVGSGGSAFGGPGFTSGMWYRPSGSGSTEAFLANSLYVLPVPLPAGLDIGGMGVSLTVGGGAGSVIRFGIYKNLGGFPDELLFDAGTVASTGTGFISVTFAAETIPEDGWYWLGYAAQVGTAPTARSVAEASAVGAPFMWAVGTSGAGSTIFNGYAKASVTGAFPDPFAIGTPILVAESPAIQILAG